MDKIWEEKEDESGKVALSESQHSFSLACFRRFVLLRGGVPVILEQRKARELLAFLACEEGKPLSKMTAAAALWPEATQDHALDNLYKVCRYLENMAQRGDAPRISTVRGSLWLNLEQVDCDILLFQRLTGPFASIETLRQAVELYRGPLLVEEAYEWTERLEGFYDMCYLETVERLRDYFYKKKRLKEADYYARLLCL